MRTFILICWTFILWVNSTQFALGQIAVPKEVKEHKLIPAKLMTPIPEGAILADGGWEVIGATKAQVPDIKQIGQELVFTGPPGEYTVIYDGVILKPWKLNGEDHNDYLGRIKDRAIVTILGEVPPDPINPPQPPTPPGGKKQMVMFYQAETVEQLPLGQQNILKSLTLHQELAKTGHVLIRILDDDTVSSGVSIKLSPWIKAAKDQPLPCIAIAPITGGSVPKVYPLPENYEALLKLLDGGKTK